ncbi:hypothetical protein [Streptomyces sp. TLI_146]|uniref:hypothetical protein n=1 Tax=Streptomyces sp. TLI_146 TaxID=1938858 RepID=UPI00117EECDD|nr:hypothetical protein [Streptomyces sp. TLI_146]
MFASMIVILANREKINHRTADAARALKLLLSAFFGLAIVAYLEGVVRGEQECPRAQTESVINGGSLAVGAVAVLVSLSWLVLAFDRYQSGVLRYFRTVVISGSAFVVVMLVVSSVGYLDATSSEKHTTSDWAMCGFGLFAIAATQIVPRIRRLHARELDGRMPDGEIESRWDRRVSRGASAGLIFFGFSALASSAAASRPTRYWYPVPAEVAYVTAWSSLVGPVIAISLCVFALAQVPDRGKEAPEATGAPS